VASYSYTSMATLTTDHHPVHRLDELRAAEGYERDPVSLDIGDSLRPAPFAMTVGDRLALLAETRMNVAAKRAAAPVKPAPSCPACGGCGLVNFVEGDAVPARFVPAGDGDFERDGVACPECRGAS
jgi:hypothetical protein